MKPKNLLIISLVALLLFLAACGGQEEPTPAPQPTQAVVEEQPTAVPPTAVPPTELPPTEVPPTEIPPTEVPAAEPESLVAGQEHVPDPRLTNITWEWLQRNPNGNDIPEIMVPNPENYTLFFNDDGSFSATIDCNQAAGKYATPNPGSIFMEIGPSTLAACPEGSLELDMANMFGPAQSYQISEDGSTLQFAWAAGGPIDVYHNAAAEIPGETEVKAIDPDAIQISTGALATSYQWEVVPGSPIPAGPGGAGYPTHIVITFDGQSAQDANDTNGSILYIFPTEAYIAMYNASGSSAVTSQVLRLQELIAGAETRTEIPESPMPLLPPPSSFMGRWAQFADLDFGVGSGVRYVSEAPNRQGIGPWTNLGTAYYYEGLTTDNRFYVSLRWPVSTAALPNTPEDVPDDVLAASTNPDTYPVYLQETIAALNALAPTDWSPSLAAIDSLAASITFPTGAAAEESPTGDEEKVDLPAPVDGVATGTVTAPDGVFIRTGPGTEYPSVGAVPFGESGEIVGVSEDRQWWVFDAPVGLKLPDNQGWVSAQFIAAQNAENVPVIPAPAVEPPLTGITWNWVSETDPAGVTTVDNPSSYTVLFNEGGTANIKADCNNVAANYTTDGGSISITLGPSTLAACAPGSLDQQFLADLSSAAVYFFEEGDLFIDTKADGGTMRFSAKATTGTTPVDPESPAAADGTLFNVVSFGAVGSEQAVLEGTSITALFNNSTVTGSAGCNDYNAQLTPVDDHFTVGPIASTKKICSDPAGIMDQEQAYLAALQATGGYKWASELVNGTTVITSGQIFYTTAENTPGVINLTTK